MSDEGLAILVDGFLDNPVLAWAFPEESRRSEALETFFGLFLRSYGEHGVLEVTEDGAGAAVWAAPGTPSLEDAETAALVALLRDHNGERANLVMAGFAQVVPPAEPHWYLFAIAARRGQRARGVGARLLEPFLARADGEGVPVYLESSNPRNLSFYHRYGFSDLGPRIDLPESGPPLQPMWRPVRSGS